MQISESQVGRAIRTKRWKYSVRAPGKSGIRWASSNTYVEDFLYDLEHDPLEQKNLVSDPAFAALRRELAEILKRRMADAGESIPEITSVEANG